MLLEKRIYVTNSLRDTIARGLDCLLIFGVDTARESYSTRIKVILSQTHMIVMFGCSLSTIFICC
jgi:hypothetical protein